MVPRILQLKEGTLRSMYSINGLFHREMLPRQIPLRLLERIMLSRYTPKLRRRRSSYGSLISSGAPTFRQVIILSAKLISGWILTGEAVAGKTRRSAQTVHKTIQTLRDQGLDKGLIEFKSGKEITEMFEMIDGPMEGEIGYYNPMSVIFLSLEGMLTLAGLGESRRSDLSRCFQSARRRRYIPF